MQLIVVTDVIGPPHNNIPASLKILLIHGGHIANALVCNARG